jgi:photosystem II stability/assembly factor-like uncharacterized protein
LLLLALVPGALAHRPHSVVPAIALPDDFDATGIGWAVTTPGISSMLMRTEDGGAHWDYVGGAATTDVLTAGGYSGSTLVWLSEEANLWTTDDEGGTWLGTALPATGEGVDLDLADGQFAAATAGGIVMGEVGDPAAARLVRSGEFVAIAFAPGDPSRVAAVAADGALHVSVDGGLAWTAETPVEALGTAVAWMGEAVALGTDTAGVLVWDDSFVAACGAIPADGDPDKGGTVARLASLDDGRLAVAMGSLAIYISDDDCASFTLHDVGTAMVPEYGGIGGAATVYEGYSTIVDVGEHVLVGGWNGLAESADAGETWSVPRLLPSDYMRANAFSPDFANDHRFAAGTYGGGVVWTDSGGETWAGSALGISAPYGYDVEFAPDYAESRTMFFAALTAYRTFDAGLTWEEFTVPTPRARVLRHRGERLFVLGEDTHEGIQGQVAYSDDGGDTWVQLDALEAAITRSPPAQLQVATVLGETTWLVAVDNPPGVYASLDEGASWTDIYDAPEQSSEDVSSGLEVWTGEGTDRIVYAAETIGVQLSDDLGANWRSPTTDAVGYPMVLHMTSDGTLFVANRDASIWRSTDGGESWAQMGETLPSTPLVLRSSPDFATDGLATAGTLAGAYWSDDHGESWHLLRRFERFEDQSYHMACTPVLGGDCPVVDDARFGVGMAWSLTTGDTVTFSFDGPSFRVVGPLAGQGSLAVRIDGKDLGSFAATDAGIEVDGLVEDWHDVVLTAEGDVPVDAIEAYGPGEVIPGLDGGTGETGETADSGGVGETGGPPGSRCSCGSASGGHLAWALGTGIVLVARRVRRCSR